jgi:hypothetical protein
MLKWFCRRGEDVARRVSPEAVRQVSFLLGLRGALRGATFVLVLDGKVYDVAIDQSSHVASMTPTPDRQQLSPGSLAIDSQRPEPEDSLAAV